jgi:hypothetical protein
MALEMSRWESINYTVPRMYTVTTTYDLRKIESTKYRFSMQGFPIFLVGIAYLWKNINRSTY